MHSGDTLWRAASFGVPYVFPRLCHVCCCAALCCNSCSQARSALQQHIEEHGVFGLPHEAVRAAFGLPPSSSLMSESRGEAIKAATPKYNNTQVRLVTLHSSHSKCVLSSVDSPQHEDVGALHGVLPCGFSCAGFSAPLACTRRNMSCSRMLILGTSHLSPCQPPTKPSAIHIMHLHSLQTGLLCKIMHLHSLQKCSCLCCGTILSFCLGVVLAEA